MPQQDNLAADVQERSRLALFASVFVAGLIGGAVFTSTTLAHSRQARPAFVGQVSVAPEAQAPVWAADPSLPDATDALAKRRHERPEAVAPTF